MCTGGREREVRDGAWHIGRELWNDLSGDKRKEYRSHGGACQRAVPHDLVEEAYSSSTVRKVLRERDGIAKDDVRQALCRMRDAGVRRVIVFPTHIIDGIEDHRMKQEVTDCAPWFEDVRIADALLKTPEDYQRTAEALWKSVAAEAGSSPVIFMGHGSEHAADESYERLECVLAQVIENDV